MKSRKQRSRFQSQAGFYNFDALLLSFFLLLASLIIINSAKHWGLKWLEWVGAALFLFAIGLYLYLSFLRR
jgi:isoprenylcysteine carboxyl methyltransferase (ICMT) family protein YpbQ